MRPRQNRHVYLPCVRGYEICYFEQQRNHGGYAVPDRDRVPFQTLLDYLEGGDSLDEFLEDFPSVARELAVAALQEAGDLALAHARVA
jgi:uncharacterized protein (DUF433 family)